MASSRNYWQCPAPLCSYAVAWAMTGRGLEDGDPGFLLMLHVQRFHPAWVGASAEPTLADIISRSLAVAGEAGQASPGADRGRLRPDN